MKVRNLAQQFVEWKDREEQWKFPGNKYSAAYVWRDINLKGRR